MNNSALYLPREPGVYIIRLNNGACYVGKTLKSIYTRVRHHLNASSRLNKSQVIHQAISKHGISQIISLPCGGASPDEISRLEVAQIQAHRDGDIKLYNMTDGGDGKPGFSWSEKTRAKIVPALTLSWDEKRKAKAREMAACPQRKALVSSSQKASWTKEKREAQRQRMRANAPAKKLTEAQVLLIWAELANGQSCAFLGRKYGVTPEAISAIKTGKNWHHVTGANRH
jgi:group I intron endonuclease